MKAERRFRFAFFGKSENPLWISFSVSENKYGCRSFERGKQCVASFGKAGGAGYIWEYHSAIERVGPVIRDVDETSGASGVSQSEDDGRCTTSLTRGT